MANEISFENSSGQFLEIMLNTVPVSVKVANVKLAAFGIASPDEIDRGGYLEGCKLAKVIPYSQLRVSQRTGYPIKLDFKVENRFTLESPIENCSLPSQMAQLMYEGQIHLIEYNFDSPEGFEWFQKEVFPGAVSENYHPMDGDLTFCKFETLALSPPDKKKKRGPKQLREYKDTYLKFHVGMSASFELHIGKRLSEKEQSSLKSWAQELARNYG